MKLRREISTFERPDGGLDLYDPLLDRLLSLSPDETVGFRENRADVVAKVEGQMMTENDRAQLLRESVYAGRAARRRHLAPSAEVGHSVRWAMAEQLPSEISPAWRVPERWRRLGEEHTAGRRYLILRGFLGADWVQRALEIAATNAFAPLTTDLVAAERIYYPADERPEVLDFIVAEPLRYLVGAVLGLHGDLALPAGFTSNLWRMVADDYMGVHPDGPNYRATVSIGLCEQWTAAQGGAVAFGVPSKERGGGFEVRERFLPFAGDMCIFAPSHDTWHCVEAVREGCRLSLTGWYTDL